MSIETERAAARFSRSDQLWKLGRNVVFAYFFLATIFIMAQLFIVQQAQQQALDQSISDNAKQHAQTQEYIRCVASALLIPLSQREADVFDKCGINADPTTDQSETPQSGSAPAANAAPTVLPPAQAPVPAPTTPQQTTSSPPDPGAEAAPEESRGIIPNLLEDILSPVRALIGNERR